jgi:hypothetical protein
VERGLLKPMKKVSNTNMKLCFFLTEYIRHVIIFNYRQENTYLDLDLSGEGEGEEKPHERGQRGSVAFVREIASVYFNQVGNEIVNK